jgi:hypothetical protein
METEPAARIPFTENDLSEFLLGLRSHGFLVGPEQLVAANALLMRLAAVRRLPENPRDLSGLIGPIVCRSGKQQKEFHRIFDVWIGQMTRADEGLHVIILPPLPETPPPTPHEQEQLTKQIARYKHDLMLVRLTMLALAFLWTLIVVLAFSVDWRRIVPPSLLPATPIFGTIFGPATQPGSQPGAPSPSAPPPPATPQQPPPKPREKPPAPERNQPSVPRLPPWWLVALITMGAGLAAANYISQRRFLSRGDDDKAPPNLDNLATADLATGKWLPTVPRDIVVRMRRREVFEDEHLDIAATVAATCANAGRFTSVVERRSRVPEYLVLIERASLEDVRAYRAAAIVDRLKAQGVFAEIFYFDGDPRVVFPGAAGAPPMTVPELAVRYPEHRLVICSEGKNLVSPFDGLAHSWLSAFTRWEHRSLLTLVPAPDWDFRERALSSAGFRILPCTPDGFGAIADVRLAARLAADAKAWLPPSYPAAMEDEEDWIYENRPPEEVVQRGLRQLHDYLGQTGVEWLAACAVYPEIKAGLTLHLGGRIAWPYESSILERLARLPFMRHAFMPDWMRVTLLDILPGGREKTIRDWIRGLLLSRGGSKGEVLLEIVQAHPRELARLWRLHSPRWAEEKGAPAADRVFLSWMNDRLAVRVSRNFIRGLRPSARWKRDVTSETLSPDTAHSWSPTPGIGIEGGFTAVAGMVGAAVFGYVYDGIVNFLATGGDLSALLTLLTFVVAAGVVAWLVSRVVSSGRIRGFGFGLATGAACALAFLAIRWEHRVFLSAAASGGAANLAALWTWAGHGTAERATRFLLWFVESGTLVALAAVVGWIRATKPFCPRCQNWTETKRRVYGPFADEATAKTDLLCGRYTRFFALSRLAPHKIRATAVEIDHCVAVCLGTTLISVSARGWDRNDKGEVTSKFENALVERLYVPGNTAREVFEWVTATSSIRPNLAPPSDPLFRKMVDALLPLELSEQGLHVFGELPQDAVAKARVKLGIPRGMPIAAFAVHDFALWFIEVYSAYAFTENGIYAYHGKKCFTPYSQLAEIMTLPIEEATKILEQQQIAVLGPADVAVVRTVLRAVESWQASR